MSMMTSERQRPRRRSIQRKCDKRTSSYLVVSFCNSAEETLPNSYEEFEQQRRPPDPNYVKMSGKNGQKKSILRKSTCMELFRRYLL